MAKAATLNLDIVAKADQALETFEKVKEKASTSSGAMKLAMVGAATGVLAALGDATKAAADHQVVVAKVAQAYKDAHIPTTELAGSLEEIEKRSRETGQSAEDNITAYGRLVAATHDTAKAHSELATAEDLAAFKGVSVTDAAKAINSATQGNTKALKEMGIATTDAAGKALPAAVLMAKLTAAVHGQADAFGQTAVGGMARYKESVEQAKEKVGEALLPALQQVLKTLQPLFDWLSRNTAIIARLAPLVAIFAGAIIAVNVALKAMAAAQAVVNAVMAANPIGLVILAIAALAAGAIYAYNHFAPFRRAVQDVFGALKVLADWVMAHWQLIVDILLGPIGVLLTNLNTVKAVIADIIQALRDVGDAASKALGWLGKIPHGAGSILSHIPNPFSLAATATATGAPPVAITIYATPGDDLPETVYQALRTYQHRHARPELGPLFAGRGA